MGGLSRAFILWWQFGRFDQNWRRFTPTICTVLQQGINPKSCLRDAMRCDARCLTEIPSISHFRCQNKIITNGSFLGGSTQYVAKLGMHRKLIWSAIAGVGKLRDCKFKLLVKIIFVNNTGCYSVFYWSRRTLIRPAASSAYSADYSAFSYTRYPASHVRYRIRPAGSTVP